MRRPMRHLVLSLLLACGSALLPPPLLAQAPAPAPASAAPASPSAQALAVYEEGKKLYDAGDYQGARGKFLQAARLEPENARWFYNLGLVQRQLDNYQAARQSFLRARELNPDYKKAEIDAKLASMGFDPADSSAQAPSRNATREREVADEGPSGLWIIGGVVLLLGGIGYVVHRLGRSTGQPGKAAAAEPALPSLSPGLLDAETARLAAASAQLVQVEHALRLGEHPDLRARLDYATRIETSARKLLEQAGQGGGVSAARLAKAVDDAAAAAEKAVALACQVHGEAAFAGRGERSGCFFCAKPIANPEAGQPVALQGLGGQRTGLLACPECAARTGRGEAPLVRTGADGRTHWSEIPGYDPYAERHGFSGAWQDVPAWRFQPERDYGELAQMSGGRWLAGGALAATALGAASLLDLESVRQSALAQEAAQATARSQREASSSSAYDHS